jgi:pilus assembly protein CpaE
VFSPKGGTGKSVIATNLAVALAADGVKTLLVDLGLELGDDALMLGSDPRRTIFDLVAAPGALDTEKLIGYATRHASGLDVLAAPLRPEQAELVTEEKLTRILGVARDAYAAVVIDTPGSFHGTVLAAIDRTDALLVVCELDMTTLKNVRVTLETLDLMRFPAERVSLVLNQPSPSRAMKRSELEAALGHRVRFEVPYDEGVPASVGLGKPIVLTRSGGFARAISKIASELVPQRSKRGWSVTPDPQNGKSPSNAKPRRWALGRGKD